MSGEELPGLAEEQAALRRVATLVARGARPEAVFAAVTEEVGRLLPVDFADLGRCEPDGTMTFLASWGTTGPVFPPGARFNLGGKNVSTVVAQTGRPTRIESYADASGPVGVAVRATGVRAAVGTPIIVDDRLWGAMAAGSSREEPMPADTERRLAQFTELLATAIANAQSRASLARLAEEQAALRRVATLVARGTRPEDVFASVVDEVGRLLPVDMVSMGRYESGSALTFVAAWGRAGEHLPVGSRMTLGGENLGTIVLETGRPTRVDGYANSSSGPIGVVVRDAGILSAVAAPIMVEGCLWGVIAAGSKLKQPLPADTEARLGSLTELVATAVANAESRAALDASRARIVAAADESRRRIERELHDGTEQQLVLLMLELRAARAQRAGVGELRARLARTAEALERALEELREISRGIHPAILSRGGLGPAIRALARRSAVPVELNLRADRRPCEPVEVAAYYVVSEALTNAAKHAHVSLVNIELDAHDTIVRVMIRDDGIGGADPSRGSGLAGLRDRVEALGGRLAVTSPAGRGTTVRAEIPADGRSCAEQPEP